MLVDEEMVMMPVPRRLVNAVYRLIVSEGDKLEAAAAVQNGSGTEQPEPGSYSSGWNEHDLRDVLENGTRALKVILPYLAERPDQRVKGQELAELVYGPGSTPQQLGGALGSFTKTALKKYRRHNWPFSAVRNDEEQVWEYVMYEGTAKIVRKLLGE